MTETPDFDNMTPEQLMAWMESLAKRQGASEGFTTAADMQVAEIDPSTVDQSILEQEYVPYGWKKEDWRAHLAKEEEKKRAAQASQPAAPKPVPTPPSAPSTPATPPPAPAAAQPPAASTPAPAAAAMPDFDSMTPEQLMAWMESLAKRQGASEGFTTAADMQVAEIDPSTVDQSILEQEYVPYGWKKEDWHAHLAKEEEKKRAAQASKSAAPAPQPPAAEPLPDLGDVLKPPSLDDLFSPAATLESAVDEDDTLDLRDVLKPPSLDDLFSPAAPAVDTLSFLKDDDEEETAPAPALDDPLAWLSELTGDTPAHATALDDLSAGLAELDKVAAPSSDDPLSWLASLTGESSGASIPDLAALDSLSGLEALADLETHDFALGEADPLTWLESLAAQEGAATEELITPANVVIPTPSELTSDGPGYQPYSFEHVEEPSAPVTPVSTAEIERMLEGVDTPTDPEAWLDALAQGVQEEHATRTIDDPLQVMEALNSGEEVAPEEIANFFEQMFNRAEQMGSEELVGDEDLPPVKAEIPDWLQEQYVSSAVSSPAATSAGDDALLAALDLNDEAVAENVGIPDWLLDSAPADKPEDISSIFADANTVPAELVQQPVLQIDKSDPWVMALTQEVEEEEQLKAWYESQVQKVVTADTLREAELPLGDDLPQGEARDVPDWLVPSATPQVVVETPPVVVSEVSWLDDVTSGDEAIPDWLQAQVDDNADDALPDWLAGADIDPDEVPDWLRETIEEKPAAPIAVTPPAPEPMPAVVALPTPKPTTPAVVTPPPPPRPAVSPAPVPAAARIDVAATLQAAREKAKQDIAASLQDYEAVVRANSALDVVVEDLSKLVQDAAHKSNPAVYRVMGDALMRQGQLQQALETYRKALNLL